MRVDLFLKLMGLAKTRMGVKRLLDQNKILLNNKPLKPSHELVGGEVLDIHLPFKHVQGKVLAIPGGKSVAKRERLGFFEVVLEEEV